MNRKAVTSGCRDQVMPCGRSAGAIVMQIDQQALIIEAVNSGKHSGQEELMFLDPVVEGDLQRHELHMWRVPAFADHVTAGLDKAPSISCCAGFVQDGFFAAGFNDSPAVAIPRPGDCEVPQLLV